MSVRDGFEAAIGQHYLWGYMLAVLAIHGPGALCVDRLLDSSAVQARWPHSSKGERV